MTALALALLLSIPAPFDGRVVAVHDGDTISVLHDGRALRVRLHGIDAPELGQAFGRPAKQFLSSLVFKRVVHVVPVDVDRYHRLVRPKDAHAQLVPFQRGARRQPEPSRAYASFLLHCYQDPSVSATARPGISCLTGTRRNDD
jgi:hypothetical protein